MAVMAREAWTDERLDELAARMDKGFDDVKVEVRDLRSDMGKGFERVDADIRELRSDMKKGFERVDDRFVAVDTRFDSLQRTMIIGFVTLFASIVASVIGGLFAVLALV